MSNPRSPLTTPEAAASHLCAPPVEHAFTGQPPKSLICNPFFSRNIEKIEAGKVAHCEPASLFPTIASNRRRDVVDLCYMPDGVRREFMLCGHIQQCVADPAQKLLLFVFTSDRSHDESKPYMQLYHTDNELQAAGNLVRKGVCAAIKDIDFVAVGHEGHVDILKREPYPYRTHLFKVWRSFVLNGDRPNVIQFIDNTITVATEEGSIIRYGIDPAMQKWKMNVGKPVYGLYAQKNRVFVACVGELSVWNVTDPKHVKKNASFNGHVCQSGRLGFDVSEKFRLVGASGDDGEVRLWRLSGGDPIGNIGFGAGKAQRIKFVEGDGKLSMWVETKEKLYVCGVGEWGVSSRTV